MTTKASEEQAPKQGRLRDGGWTPMYREVWTHYLPAIGKDALVYYLYLLNFRNTDEKNERFGKAWPGRNKAAADLGIAKKSLQYIDKVLEAAGLVEIEHVPNSHGRPRIQYIVNDPLPAADIDMDALKQVADIERFPTKPKKVSIETEKGFVGNMINNYISIPNDQDLDKECERAQSKDFASFNPKDIISYFANLYEVRYGEAYVVDNWARWCRSVKTKLIEPFGSSKAVKIIDTALALYADKWATEAFPRPTLAWLCGWGANAVLPIVPADDDPTATASDSPALTLDELKARGLLG